MLDRTKRYIDSLSGNRSRVMIPSVVAAEYLAGFSNPSERSNQMSSLERYFFVPPLDAPAATLAATLFDNMKRTGALVAGQRQRIKADCYIVATAITHGADTIVTSAHERGQFTRIAGGMINVIEVPSVPQQGTLLPDSSDA